MTLRFRTLALTLGVCAGTAPFAAFTAFTAFAAFVAFAASVAFVAAAPYGGAAVVVAPARAAALGALVAERPALARPGYWTRARMSTARSFGAARERHAPHRRLARHHAGRRVAREVYGVTWAGGGLVARTTGRVFFTLDGTDYSCSGSVVGGASTNLVVTAAHCVSDGAGGWARNWTFIPGYSRGRAPFGRYPAKVFTVAAPWADGADTDDDVAFVTVGTARIRGANRHVANAAGAQPIAFGAHPGRADVFGYPAEPPFTGRKLDYCAGPVLPDPYGVADIGIACAMSEGDSGGPWLSGFNPRTGRGTITGVSSFKYSGGGRALYSPDLGAVAQDLYTRAEQGR